MKEFRGAKPKGLQNFMKELHIPTGSDLDLSRSPFYIHEFIYTKSEIIIIIIKDSINPKSIFFSFMNITKLMVFPNFKLM